MVNGRTNDPLTPDGRIMAEELWKRLKNKPIDKLFSSDLTRAYDTAILIQKASEWDTEAISSKLLRERFHGKYEWWSLDILKSDRKALWMEYDEFCDYSPEIESPKDIIKRRLEFYETELIGKNYEHVYIITHWWFVRLVFMYLMWIESDYYFSHFEPIRNCSITSFRDTPKGFVLTQFNA